MPDFSRCLPDPETHISGLGLHPANEVTTLRWLFDGRTVESSYQLQGLHALYLRLVSRCHQLAISLGEAGPLAPPTPHDVPSMRLELSRLRALLANPVTAPAWPRVMVDMQLYAPWVFWQVKTPSGLDDTLRSAEQALDNVSAHAVLPIQTASGDRHSRFLQLMDEYRLPPELRERIMSGTYTQS